VRVSKLFLLGQSENISISVKDDIRFGGVFPLSVITSNCNRIKFGKVCFGKGFRCHSLISLSQTVHARNHTKKLANMPAKRKCKKGIAIQTDLNRSNENAVEDLSCTTKTQARLKVTHPVSSITFIHILSITITTFAAKESVVITFFVIFRTHFNILEKNLRQSRDLQPLNTNQ
jgi:hypothetical protein